MKTLSKIIAVAALALGPALSAGAAHAISPNYTEAAISKLNWDGFKACKALGDSGYTAVTRGTHSAGRISAVFHRPVTSLNTMISV